VPRTRSKPHSKAAAVLKPGPKPKPTLWIRCVICLAILAGTWIVYAPVRHFDFVNFDDPDMVSANPHVRLGMSAAGLRWAFTSVEAANWFPITRLSHLLDYQRFGVHSGGPHVVNVLLHALTAMVLFLFLDRATRAVWRSALVALVFALHPLHVESVAWVSERKDVLSALFWFLALWAYVRYTERPGVGRYLAVLLCFVLGLMSKPMIVTLPFVLLLLDFWPLRRPLNGALIREKLPLLALAVLAAVATLLVQQNSGAVETGAAFPVWLRVQNALEAYCIYIGKTLWPSGLAIFYPYPSTIAIWVTGLAACALAAISAGALRLRQRAPYLAVGWFWFVGTLVPVIGLIQVGSQARADRYTYVPMVGLAIAVVWSAADLLRRWPRAQIALAAAVPLACLPVARAQVECWRNSETLFRHALAVTSGNDVAEHNLGNYLLDVPDRLPEAMEHLKTSLRIYPQSAKAHVDLGTAMARAGQEAEALAEFQEAVRLAPGSPLTHDSLAKTLVDLGRLPEAVEEYRSAIRLAPDSAIPHNNLGNALAKMGRVPDAIGEYETALRLDPQYAEAHNNLGVVLSGVPGRLPEAIRHLETVVRLNPDSATAHLNLGIALAKDRARLADAIAEFEVSLRLQPNADLQRAVERLRASTPR
jgi:tetratricopeptide (TPR) repeat protein